MTKRLLSLVALFHRWVMNLKVESRDSSDPNTCLSSAVVTRPTAFGMNLAVFSFEILATERMGIWSCEGEEEEILY
jgi:hypothetical protein